MMAKRLVNPAVILNAEAAGIGIIHSLQIAGIDMITVERSWPPAYGRFSRYPKQHVRYGARGGATVIEALLHLAGHFDGKGVLYPSTDVDLEHLITARDELAMHYHVPAADHLATRILEKNWQYELAERTGVPIPRCTRFRAGDTPDLAGLRFPLIVKPSSRAEAAGDKVFRLRVVDDADQLHGVLEHVAKKFPGRQFQVAENIPGEPDQLYTVGSYSDRHGRLLRSFSGRKLTQHPFSHGMASVAESLAAPPEVLRYARVLLEEARFHGISQVEFKYDRRDQQYKLLEVNGRAWLWVKLAAFSGVNLPLIQYYDLTGDPQLSAAIAAAQRDDRFFVFDHHVKLNQIAAERALIRALRRRKTMISAIRQRGDWKLSLAHSVIGGGKRLLQRRGLHKHTMPTMLRAERSAVVEELV